MKDRVEVAPVFLQEDQEQIAQMVKVIPPERPLERMMEQEQIVDIFVPPIMEGFGIVVHLTPQRRTKRRAER